MLNADRLPLEYQALSLRSRREKESFSPNMIRGSKAHLVGGDGGSGGGNSGKLTLSEVKKVQDAFMPQLQRCQQPWWIQKNYFCTIRIRSSQNGLPPILFGRVNACLPMEGYFQNVEYLELDLPRLNDSPTKVTLSKDEILIDDQTQSYYLKVCFLSTAEDISDFEGDVAGFQMLGFDLVPVADNAYFETMHLMPRESKSILPWIYIISSKWIYARDPGLYNVILSNIYNLIQRRIIVNFHPSDIPSNLSNLNSIFGFIPIPGETNPFFPTTNTANITLTALETLYDRMFGIPLSNVI